MNHSRPPFDIVRSDEGIRIEDAEGWWIATVHDENPNMLADAALFAKACRYECALVGMRNLLSRISTGDSNPKEISDGINAIDELLEDPHAE